MWCKPAEIYPGIITGMVDGTGLTVTLNRSISVPRHVSLGQDRQNRTYEQAKLGHVENNLVETML